LWSIQSPSWPHQNPKQTSPSSRSLSILKLSVSTFHTHTTTTLQDNREVLTKSLKTSQELQNLSLVLKKTSRKLKNSKKKFCHLVVLDFISSLLKPSRLRFPSPWHHHTTPSAEHLAMAASAPSATSQMRPSRRLSH
jgi:hypothetical protein